MTGITLDAVTKIYSNGVRAVDAVDLEINEGEFVVLVGPSGCGKSTLLRMIAGLEDVSDGSIAIGGEDVTERPPQKRDIAMVFQNYALYPHMTVRENLAYGLRLRKLPKEEWQRRVKETAATLGLDELLDRKPSALSGGQRQRVAMGRAIVREPKAFLMDEPLSNLDAKLRVSMRAELAKLHERLGVTTVYVTHDQVEAMTMGDRIAVMLDGVLQQVDTPTQVYDRPANLFVAGFIGSPQMNLAVAPIEEGPVVSLGQTRIPIPREFASERKLETWVGKHVIVGIRPEDLQGEGQNGGGPTTTMKGTIERIEALGAILLGYFSVEAEAPKGRGVVAAAGDEVVADASLTGSGGTQFCATFEPRSAVRVGDEIEVTVPVERLHFFDPDTEESLSAGSRPPEQDRSLDSAEAE
jgi:multiple sugar transport system ATP-binding protein